LSDLTTKLLSGNEAVALGAWQAGCRVGAAYPGTPSSEILPALVECGRRLGGDVYCEWSVNEKVALEVAHGAAIAGARALAAMKHVGLNVAGDPFFTIAYTGVEAGLVVVSADDPGLHSSQNEQDNRFYARHAGVPLLEPSDSQESCDFARLAFALSEEYDLPVLLRLTTRVAHSRTPVTFAADRSQREPGGASANAAKYVMIPANAARRHVRQLERLHALARWAEDAPLNRIEDGSGGVGFITGGLAYQHLREVMPDAPVLRLGLVYPLPERLVHSFCEWYARVIVVEEGERFLYEQVCALGARAERMPDDLRVGELTVERVRGALSELGVLPDAAQPTPAQAADLPARPPVLCPGCAHRAAFTALRRLGVFVAGDIGCYTLAALDPLGALHTCLAMGAGLNQAHGIAKATGGQQKPVAVIGDSTFTHMGMPGLLNAVYNGGNYVTVILDNRSTAMTGGQDHPGTGRTLMGSEAPAMDFAAVARALGVSLVLQVNEGTAERIESALRQAMDHDGPAVVICSGPCPLRYNVRSEPLRVLSDECQECRRCLEIACPALGWDEVAERPVIDEVLCTGCGLCAEECSFGAIAVSGEGSAR
jgi:indolepyruvate ferredoxin oxidoreductase alpha subunit